MEILRGEAFEGCRGRHFGEKICVEDEGWEWSFEHSRWGRRLDSTILCFFGTSSEAISVKIATLSEQDKFGKSSLLQFKSFEPLSFLSSRHLRLHAAVMKTTWMDIAPVPSSQEFLDVVLSRTQRRLPTQIRPGFKISRIRGVCAEQR